MSKKKVQKTEDIKKALKQEEDKKRETMKKQEPKKKEESKISFDVWYAKVVDKIPAHHRKEVIKVDMKARGIEGLQTKEAWNKALELYGVKLKTK